MDKKRVYEITQSYGIINVSYNGMPVWIEGVQGDEAEVTFIGMDRRINVPVSALAEADPMQTM